MMAGALGEVQRDLLQGSNKQVGSWSRPGQARCHLQQLEQLLTT